MLDPKVDPSTLGFLLCMKYTSQILKSLSLVAIVVAFLAMPGKLEAKEAGREAGASATLASRASDASDDRADRLEAYLVSHRSPLAPYAKVFVAKADEYNLDWRLVAAISGVESTFGKRIPAHSYNAYGWNGGYFSFKSWEDGIDTVSKTLREKYANKWGADTVWEIAPYYAPPSKTWAGNVNFFMEKIATGPKPKRATLALELSI